MKEHIASDRRGTGSIKWDLARSGEIPLWVADMDFPVASCITDALTARIAHPVYGYTAVPPDYREAFSRWQERRNGWRVLPEETVVVPGVMPSISLLVENCTRPGDGVAVFTPVYFPFFEVVEELGRKVQWIPLDVEYTRGVPRHTIDEQALDRALQASRMLLLCSPHNPGGRVWTREELTTIADCADRYDVPVVSDEIHSDLLFPGEQFVPWLTVAGETSRRGDVALQAPSKTFNIPGLPTAFAVIPDERSRSDFERILHARKQDNHNLLALAAAHAAYIDGEQWLEEVRAELVENYRVVRDTLADLEGVAVYRMEGTFIAWIDFSARWKDCPGATRQSRQFDSVAREHGVWLSQGSRFGPGGEGHMRLNFATTADLLREGLVRVGRALAEFDRVTD
jgi:cysteine-S-conjugate beta-lyase